MRNHAFARNAFKYLNYFLAKLGFRLVPMYQWVYVNQISNFYWNDPFLNLFNSPNKILELIPDSRSQVRQDLFVISELGFKRGGYFVEFRAQNSKDGSNSYMLEKKFGWQGIVCEPSRQYHESLKNFRDCEIDFRCVWSSSGEYLKFSDLGDTGLSTLTSLLGEGLHGATRSATDSKEYLVESVSLNQLLIDHRAPVEIDYISIDTEGSEFGIYLLLISTSTM